MSLPLDYYSILSLPRSCDSSALRLAYREAALLSHPSKAVGVSAEQANKQFLLISEAFHVLHNPLTRALFDQYGESGLKGGVVDASGRPTIKYSFDVDPEQLFRQQFGHNSPDYEAIKLAIPSLFAGAHVASSGNSALQAKAAAQEIPLYVSLEELDSGAARKVKILRNRLAPASTDDQPQYVVEERYLNVELGLGWKDGTRLTFKGEGDEEKGKQTGDIVVVVKEKPHPRFQRRGADLLFTASITLLQALTGCTVTVAALDGRQLPVAVHEIVNEKYEKVVANEGIRKNANERGNLIIQFNVQFPSELDSQQKEALKKILTK